MSELTVEGPERFRLTWWGKSEQHVGDTGERTLVTLGMVGAAGVGGVDKIWVVMNDKIWG